MLCVGGVHVLHGKGQVELALSQVIGLFPVSQPGELQGKVALPVPQENQLVAAVGGIFLPYRLKAQGLIVKLDAALQIYDIEIEVVESEHYNPPVRRLASGRQAARLLTQNFI